MPEILKAEHPEFPKFLKTLEGPEGCNIREVGYDFSEITCNSREITSMTAWDCDSTTAKAKAILENMVDIDVEGTLAYFKENGGICDCKIIFNTGKLAFEAPA